MITKRVTVLIVDDSLMFRTAISKGLNADPQIQVVATASNPYEARDLILKHRPDVVTLDIEMPGMNGLEFLRILMPQYPVPVVVVSAVDGIVFEAMRAGAVDFVAKPSGNGALSQFVEELAGKIKVAAVAKIRKGSAATAAPAAGAARMLGRASGELNNLAGIIAIGASTGGTEATSALLRALPQKMPGIVITQHMPPVFTRMYAERLNRECMLTVKEAGEGDVVKPGCVYIAPGDMHMRVRSGPMGFRISCAAGPKVSGHCPSVDVLFESVAACASTNAVGIILTGMGADGAKGLLKMRQRGAYTIGQDQRTCVVYGMPMEAYKLGAVCKQAPLDAIAKVLLAHLKMHA